jgi:hypothetical protein
MLVAPPSAFGLQPFSFSSFCKINNIPSSIQRNLRKQAIVIDVGFDGKQIPYYPKHPDQSPALPDHRVVSNQAIHNWGCFSFEVKLSGWEMMDTYKVKIGRIK